MAKIPTSGAGNGVGRVVETRDVRKKRERVTRSSHTRRLAALGEMAAEIAHEIRNPLNIIMGYSRQISELTKDPVLHGYAETVVDEVGRLDTIISNILEFERKEVAKKAPEDLNGIVVAVLDFLSSRLAADKVAVEWVPGNGLPPVRMDRDKIKQVLLNLIINASQAMPGGGRLKVGTNSGVLPASWANSQDRGRTALAGKDLSGQSVVSVYFDDQGTGVAGNAIHHVFDPFFTTKSVGTGLGLSVCAKIVENHGGMIQAENAKDKGSIFTVWFPVGRR